MKTSAKIPPPLYNPDDVALTMRHNQDRIIREMLLNTSSRVDRNTRFVRPTEVNLNKLEAVYKRAKRLWDGYSAKCMLDDCTG